MGVLLNRVVAVVATFANGDEQIGSGFLIDAETVLTAKHCTRHKHTDQPAMTIEVVRAPGSTRIPTAKITASQKLDVAVLEVPDPPWEEAFPPVIFARVDRSQSKMLQDCEGIGFPAFQIDPKGVFRTSEFHGTTYVTDEAKTGHLLVREDRIRPGHPIVPLEAKQHGDSPLISPRGGDPEEPQDAWTPWGGFSGTLLFYGKQAIGVVVEHHPRQGDAALRAVTFDKLVITAAIDPATQEVVEALGITGPEGLVEATGDQIEPLAGLVEKLNLTGDLPRIQDLTPYHLGATPTNYASASFDQGDDPYVPRTANNVDSELQKSLTTESLVLVVGPSKAGKTRTAFEAIRTGWPLAHILVPDRDAPGALSILATHPRVRTSTDPLVVWLDDFSDYLNTATSFTPALLTSILARQGPTIVVGTLRSEERSRLAQDAELTRAARQVLEEATQIELAPTNKDSEEQVAAKFAYPNEDLSTNGLGEQLSGAPFLLRLYRDAPPMLHAVIQTTIDWSRVGIPGPIAECDLINLALDKLVEDSPWEDPDTQEVEKQISIARTPPISGATGRVAAILTEILQNRNRGYRPFSYLMASDDGQNGPSRPIPDRFWDRALECAGPEAARFIGFSAYQRNNIDVAIHCHRLGAEAGDIHAMYNLGFLLAQQNDPVTLGEARTWYETAANSGNIAAMTNLGKLLSEQLDPPQLEQAHIWYEKAVEHGDTTAMANLGKLLVQRGQPKDIEKAQNLYRRGAESGNSLAMVNFGNLLMRKGSPKDLKEARVWFEKAAEKGDTAAMTNLGALLMQNGIPADLQEARVWFEKAAEKGDTAAMTNLGALLMDWLNPPQLEQAHIWLEKAAKAGIPHAMFVLGHLLMRKGQPMDVEMARVWYQKAAKAGHPLAIKMTQRLNLRGSPKNHWPDVR